MPRSQPMNRIQRDISLQDTDEPQGRLHVDADTRQTCKTHPSPPGRSSKSSTHTIRRRSTAEQILRCRIRVHSRERSTQLSRATRRHWGVEACAERMSRFRFVPRLRMRTKTSWQISIPSSFLPCLLHSRFIALSQPRTHGSQVPTQALAQSREVGGSRGPGECRLFTERPLERQ